ncbi:MAG: hypothetical protein ACOX0K_04890 [Oscillospiraceae bacterium]
MSKRKWTNIIATEGLIIEMRKSGKTRQEIADALGLEKAQIKNWISRHNRKQAKMEEGLPPKRRGRPRKQEMTSEEALLLTKPAENKIFILFSIQSRMLRKTRRSPQSYSSTVTKAFSILPKRTSS